MGEIEGKIANNIVTLTVNLSSGLSKKKFPNAWIIDSAEDLFTFFVAIAQH